jgi:hypothetical protein
MHLDIVDASKHSPVYLVCLGQSFQTFIRAGEAFRTPMARWHHTSRHS